MSGATAAPGRSAPGMASTGMASTATDVGGDDTCAEGTATAAPVIPTVWLVVDGSSSMAEDFQGTSRWTALRSALMDPTGVVPALETAVRFGLVIYNGPAENLIGPIIGAAGSGGSCNAPENINPLCLCFTGNEPFCCQPQCGGMSSMAPAMPAPTGAAQCENLVVVDPQLSNQAAIAAAYPMQELGGSTPTHRALERIVGTLPVVDRSLPDDMSGPTYVLLATDGAPNEICLGASGDMPSLQLDASASVLEVTRDGVQMGMRMFVVSLAGDDARLRQHLEEVAAIGSPGQPPFEPAGKDELVETLRGIIGGATCQIALNGTIEADEACTGTVTYNGEVLACNDPNGWRLVDDHTLQLTGTACETFVGTRSVVHARFPCGVFVPQ